MKNNITPGFSFKKAGTGFSYYGYKLPVNALYGTCTMRYDYTIDENGLTIKTLVPCEKICFFVDNFVPIYTARTYHEKVDVFNVHIWDGEKWFETDTASNQQYYYLGEMIEHWSKILRIHDTQCLYNHLYPKEVRPICGERLNHIKNTGSAYGYMCKTPDRTMTHGDCVPDQYAQNRCNGWKKRGVK